MSHAQGEGGTRDARRPLTEPSGGHGSVRATQSASAQASLFLHCQPGSSEPKKKWQPTRDEGLGLRGVGFVDSLLFRLQLPSTSRLIYFLWMPRPPATPPLHLRGPRNRLTRTAAPIWSAFKGFLSYIPLFYPLQNSPRGDEVNASRTGENQATHAGHKRDSGSWVRRWAPFRAIGFDSLGYTSRSL